MTLRRHSVAVLRISPAHPTVGQTSPGNVRPTAVLALAPNPATAGQQVTFTASGSSDPDGTISEYRWDFDGDGSFDATGAAATQTHAYAATGTFTARLRVVDNGGLTADATVSVTINAAGPTAVLHVTPNPALFEQLVTFDGSGSTVASGTIVSYEWDLDGNGTFERNSGSAATTTNFYFTLGTITVRLRVTDNHGLTSEASVNLLIAATHLLRIAELPPAAAPAARPPVAGRPFSARLAAGPVRGHPGRVESRGAVRSLRGMLVTGSFNARLAGGPRATRAETLLERLLRARDRARLDISVDVRTGRSSTTMLALATIPPSSRACLRITISDRPHRKPAGSFRVLGGTGAAARLAATGTFAFTPGRRTPGTFSGRLDARLVGARGLPRACTALGR